MQRFDVAVVGGGASGTFFVSGALRKSIGWTMLWVAPPDSPGVAYSSALESHLLNVPAERMGAFVDRPGDFHDWLKSSPDFPAYGPHDFVPRRVFGDYLRDLAKAALRACLLLQRWSALTGRGGASASTMAQGHAPVAWCSPPARPAMRGAKVLAKGSWPIPGAGCAPCPGDWSPPCPQQSVVIIGSGLTAIDTGAALASRTPWPVLLQTLRSEGLLAESPLGIGYVSHRPATLALLGAARFGEEFECTAVPELRGQAFALVEAWRAQDWMG